MSPYFKLLFENIHVLKEKTFIIFGFDAAVSFMLDHFLLQNIAKQP